MALHANITLQTIRCLEQSESSGSEPYIWPWLGTAALNDFTFDTFPIAAGFSDSRTIVANSMKAGSSAPLIFPGNEVMHTFLENQTDCTAILAVAVMEADDNSVATMSAGYQAYLDELRVQVERNLPRLKDATPEEVEEIIEEIKKAVRQKADDAAKGTLSTWEKFLFSKYGPKSPDVYYGATATFWRNLKPASSGPFTLDIVDVPGNHWEIDGVLSVTDLGPYRDEHPEPNQPIIR